ncbi:MAG: hypothetical protein ACREDR_14550 [Blastocatellia bacterium]
MSGTLYVFMHGLTTVSEDTGNLEVVMPRVEGHVYLAGNWLQETDLKPGSAPVLRGVKDGGATFSSTRFTIRFTGCSLTTHARAVTLWMPKPKAIFELLHSTPPRPSAAAPQPTYVAKRLDNGTEFRELATLHVLSYDYDDENEVFLEGHYWEPTPTGGAMSLHLISTSRVAEGADHQVKTEAALGRLVRNYPGLDFPAPSSAPPDWRSYSVPTPATLQDLNNLGPDDGDQFIVAPGRKFAFAQAELEPFTTRSTRLGRLGRMKQQGRPVAGIWEEPDLLGENPSNCRLLSVAK